jgi:cytochrome c peroxidase
MRQHFIFIAFVMVFFFACQKEEPIPPIPYQPTPYVPSLPIWADVMPIPADNTLTVEGIALGRKLFYEKKLSADHTMSCGSCHVQGYGFSDPKKFSVGIKGDVGTRQSMAIFNLAWNEPFFWDGRAATLEQQAHDPVVNPIELNNTWQAVVKSLQTDNTYPELFRLAFGTSHIDSTLITKAIAQFERTIVSYDSKFDHFYFKGDSTVFNEVEKRGFKVFFGKALCLHCHSGVNLSDNSLRNNGLDVVPKDNGFGDISKNADDNGRFKVVSLRNIERTAPYMHDGRFKTLEEVVEHYDSGVVFGTPNLDPNMQEFVGGLGLTQQEKKDLVTFLKTLSDDNLLTNKNWANPN